VDFEYVRAALRQLRNKGYATYERGLFTEDGEVAGSGYTCTDAGLRHYREHIDLEGSHGV